MSKRALSPDLRRGRPRAVRSAARATDPDWPIGLRMARQREARRISLATLALVTGLPVPWLAVIEAGVIFPPLVHANLVARALGQPLGEVLGLVTEPLPTDAQGRHQLLREYAGLRLRARRLLLGLSLAACGELAGVLPEMLHHYEHGHSEMTADTLWRITQALGLSPGQLYAGLDLPG